MLLFKIYQCIIGGKISRNNINVINLKRLKRIDPTHKDKFELLDGSYSVSDIQIIYLVHHRKTKNILQ